MLALFAFVPFVSGCTDQGVEPEAEEQSVEDYEAEMDALDAEAELEDEEQ